MQPEQRWQELRQDGAPPPPPPLQPLGAQCVAAEVAVGRSACRLLATVPGSRLLVAAAGSSLLLLSHAGPDAATAAPLAVLLESGSSITAVGVSSTPGGRHQWAAALEGGSATFCPVDTSGADPASFGGSPCSLRPTSISLRPGAPAFEALAWHPCEPVCALLAPHELLLVAPTSLQCTPGSGSCAPAQPGADGGSSSSGSSGGGAEEDEGGGGAGAAGSPQDGGTPRDSTWNTFRSGTVRGDWGSLSNGEPGGEFATVMLVLPGPPGAAGSSAAGRCCLAWLGGGGAGSSEAGSAGDGGAPGGRRLVVSWGGQFELLAFNEGWHLHERRQLLPGLLGPVCGLAGAGAAHLLTATEQPVAQFLGSADTEPQEQLRPGVLQRCLTAQARPPEPVLLPMLSAPLPGAAPLAASPAAEPASAPLPAAEGIIDLTRDSNPFLAAPQHPAAATAAGDGPPIPAMFMLPPSHMPLAEGLPLLPGGSPPQHGAGSAVGSSRTAAPAASDSGHASLLWLGGAGTEGAGSPLASPREHTVPLGCAADLLEVHGDLAILASSKAPPALALCQLGRGGLQRLAPLPLALPDGIPNGSTVRLRGLAVQPADAQPANGSADSGRLLVWVLLAAAQLGAAAPFLSAALSSRIYGSSKRQLWLACYALPVEAAPVAAAAEAEEAAAATAAAPAPADSAGAAAGAAEAAAVIALACGVAGIPQHAGRGPAVLAGTGTAAGAAARAPGTAVAAASTAVMAQGTAGQQVPAGAIDAVLALQQAVADVRQEMTARLDELTAGLAQLLQALRGDEAVPEPAPSAPPEP